MSSIPELLKLCFQDSYVGNNLWHAPPFSCTLPFCLGGKKIGQQSFSECLYKLSQMQPFVFQLVRCRCCEDYFRCGAAGGETSHSIAPKHVVLTSTATFFSLEHFVSRKLESSSFILIHLFGSEACCFTSFLTEAIPRRRVWDERACMCVLAWLTRWECLALSAALPSVLCVCVCCLISVCQTGCVSE